MYIIPAIDLMNGKCVRLIQGEYHRQIVYENDPARQAETFKAAGTQWIHIVDLEGAKIGRLVNRDAMAAIVGVEGMNIELGGGIRDEETIQQLLDMGVRRAIIGTKAVSDFEWFTQMANKYAGKLALALDGRGSKVATHGWTKEHPQHLLEFAAEAAKLPLPAIIYTDISKDGMMEGPNFERTKALVEAVSLPIVASGGVTSTEDITRLKQIGVEAAIIGRALYEGMLSLPDAIAAAK